MHQEGIEIKRVGNYIYDLNSKPLGRGSYGKVYLAYDENNSHKQVAVKVIPSSILYKDQQQHSLLMREIEVLNQIKGEHIACLLDVKQSTNNLYIFTEYCNGGDLENYLQTKGKLQEDEVLKILKQITKAFISLDVLVVQNAYGHKITLMHRDIKPANILLHNGEVKIADFGFAKILDENLKDLKLAHTLVGSPLYMSPQTLNYEPYSTKCDIWSTGILIYECLFGDTPWTGTTIPGLLANIKGINLSFPSKLSDETKDLLMRMLQINEENRIDWKGIWDHPALKKIKLSSWDENIKPITKEKSKNMLIEEKKYITNNGVRRHAKVNTQADFLGEKIKEKSKIPLYEDNNNDQYIETQQQFPKTPLSMIDNNRNYLFTTK